MLLRRMLLPVAILLALGLVSADLAQAAPVRVPAPAPSVAFGGVHVGVGVGVAVPLGPSYRRGYRGYRGYRGRRMRSHGQWVVEQERVWVPGELIGYDRHGHEIVTEGFWTVERRRVWVPVERHVVRPAPRGRVAVGFHFH